MARQLSANAGSRRRGGGEALPAGRRAGPRCLDAQQGHGGLAPGRRATRFVPSLVTLSTSGRPGTGQRVEQPLFLCPAGTPARDEPWGGLQPPQGTLGSPAEEKPARSLSPPGAAAGRAPAATKQQVRRSLCSYPGSQSSFFFFFSSPSLFASKCAIWVIFLYDCRAGWQDTIRCIHKHVADTCFESFGCSLSLSETHTDGKWPWNSCTGSEQGSSSCLFPILREAASGYPREESKR